MPKVKLTIVESRCRSGCMKQGDVFIVEDLCPPICHELWSMIYPNVYVLSFNEITNNVQIQALGNITLDAPPRVDRKMGVNP